MRLRLWNELVLLTSGVVVLSVLQSCSDSTAPNWSSEGVQVVLIDSMFVPDTIAAHDTLGIVLWSASVQGDKFDSLQFELVRDTTSAELTITAHVYSWIGAGAMPPTNPVPLVGQPFNLAPPFRVGPFHVTVVRPDASDLTETVAVVP